ncbi:ABC transporter substrate-binding protein [Yeguia hominis]|uniref:Carbohydrate ABC transporter substrate-binding protein n=1 Tax=Yeguia hominis TaxID=2763662 RepID=A0A926D9M3_9FIRM|nr:ABC transporter substrate-binding protein [Yeguia hominis]MBC8534368.1 carbohydrate ABC transporter substrate-binding protein [Yeguia hominis]
MKKQKLISLLFVLLLLLSCTACMESDKASSSSESSSDSTSGEIDYNTTIEYTIWALTIDESSQCGFDAGVAAAKEKFPNVTLNIEPDPQDGDVKIKTLAAAGTMPDFYVTNNALVQIFKKSNNNQAIDKWMEQTGLINQMDRDSLDELSDPLDGHIYGFSGGSSGTVDLIANMDLLDSLGIDMPTNYNEFLDFIQACHSNNITPVADSFKEGFQTALYFDFVLTREGYNLWDIDKGTISATDDVFVKAAEKVKGLVDAGMFSPSAFTISEEDARLSFLNNEAAMCRLPGTTWTDYFDSRAEGRTFKLVGYPFQDEGQPQDTANRVGGGDRNNGYAVSPTAKELDVAATWLCYFSVGNVEGLYKNGYTTEKLTTNDIQAEKKSGPLSQEYFNLKVDSITPMPWAWNHGDSYGVICEQCNKFFTGDYSVEDFTKETNEMMQEILAAD